MSESDAWSLTVWVFPFVAPAIACFLSYRGAQWGWLSYRGAQWGWAIFLSFMAALGWSLLMNFIFENPDEWALVLLVSIPWWPIVFGGAVLGCYMGKLMRQTEN